LCRAGLRPFARSAKSLLRYRVEGPVICVQVAGFFMPHTTRSTSEPYPENPHKDTQYAHSLSKSLNDVNPC
jgi:hypothetical protein